MVRKQDSMRGIHLNPRTGQVYINKSYEKFLKTMYGRKFPPHFVAMVNDLIDAGTLETLDDMKKVIRFFEWRIDTKDKTIKNMIKYNATLEESLQRVKEYAEGLEKRFEETRTKVEGLVKELMEYRQAAREGRVPGAPDTKSASDILTELRSEFPGPATVGADIGAEGELEAGDVETSIGPVMVRPREMEEPARDGAKLQAMGARLVEAEIGADEMEFSPEIKAIADKIDKVKRLEALHSDEEIEAIFKKAKDEEE
jgi:hypothetical protein